MKEKRREKQKKTEEIVIAYDFPFFADN